MVWTHIGNGFYLCENTDSKVTTGITTGSHLFESNPTTNIDRAYRFNGTVWVEMAFGSAGAADITGADNVGTGEGLVFRDEVAGVLNLKTIKAGTNITITNNANDITIQSAAGTGEANTYSSLGDGNAWTTVKSGVNFPFKSFKTGSNKLGITSNTNDLTIDVNEANLTLANIGGTIGDAKISGVAWGKISGVPAASDSAAGIVQLATPSADTTAGRAVQASDTRLSDARTPIAHNNTHALDTIGAGTDITTNNATTSQHGLLKKLSNISTEFLNGQGNWATPPSGSGEANTYSNAGVGGIGITLTKSGLNFPFKSILAASTKISVTDGGANNNVLIDVIQTNLSIGWSQLTSIPAASTTTPGIVQLATPSSDTTAGRAVQASDTRLSDARTALAHVHAAADINSGTIDVLRLPSATTAAAGIVQLATPSADTTAGRAVQASDTRLSDARTPLSHNHAAADINSGTLAVARGGLNKSSITQHALLKGGATNTYEEIAPGTNDYVLAMVAGTPAWKSLNSENTGVATANGNNSATQFTIAHGLGVVPSNVMVICSSLFTPITYTYNSTTLITVTFQTAPPTGTGNVIFNWRAIA